MSTKNNTARRELDLDLFETTGRFEDDLESLIDNDKAKKACVAIWCDGCNDCIDGPTQPEFKLIN